MKSNNKSTQTTSRTTSLSEPEAVKMYIANLTTSDSYKKNLCIAYNTYCKHYHIEWKMPKYSQEAKNIALPTRQKLEILIANAKKSYP